MFDETESVQEMYSEFMSSKEKLAETVMEYLQDKYGEKFEVKKTSSSIDSDSLELSVTSEKYPEVVFEVNVKTDDQTITDSYVRTVIAYKLQSKLIDSLEKAGIQANGKAMLLIENPLDTTDVDISVADYCGAAESVEVFSESAVNLSDLDKKTADEIIAAALEFADDENVGVIFKGYLVYDEFDKCSSDMLQYSSLTEAWFDDYSPNGNFGFYINGGSCNKSADELINDLNEG